MYIRDLQKKFRVKRGFDWKAAVKSQKKLFIMDSAKDEFDEGEVQQYASSNSDSVVVVVDGIILEMPRGVVVGMLRMGVMKPVGTLPMDIAWEAGIWPDGGNDFPRPDPNPKPPPN